MCESLQTLIERGHARRLGHVENYFVLAQRQDLYRVFAYYGEFEEPCSLRQLTQALRSICLQHPVLLCQVKPQERSDLELYYRSEEFLSTPGQDRDYIALANNVRISDVLINNQKEYAEVMRMVMEEYEANGHNFTSKIFEILAPIRISHTDPNKLNWRLLAFPGEIPGEWNKFVFLSNHVLKDGSSGAHFFVDLKDSLNSLPSDLQDTDRIFDYKSDYKFVKKIPVPIDQVLDYKPNLKQIANVISTQLVREKLGYVSPAPTITRYTDAENNTNEYHTCFINFTPKEVDSIRKKIKDCAGPSCTMTPFLQACWLVSLYKSGKVFTKSFKEWFVDIMIPMYTPQLLSDGERTRADYRYGCNVGGTRYNYLISSLNVGNNSKKFWKLVSYYNDVFRDSKVSNSYLYLIGMIMLDPACKEKNLDATVLQTLLGRHRQGTVLSNVGYFSVKGDPQDAFHLKNLLFTQTVGSYTFAFNLNVCSTDVAGMNVGASVSKGTLATRNDWEELCEIFKTTVLQM